MIVCVSAYAKLNLFLDVVGLRDDGFHEIRSLVQTIDLADRIAMEPAADIRVSCNCDVGSVNIAESALRDLLNAKKSPAGMHVFIDKRIPLGAGLGGGSSDAAAVLAVGNRLIPPLLPDSRLLQIAQGIGADVSLFLTGGCVELAGRGSPKTQHPVRSETFVVMVPNIHCSTKEVYEAWRGKDGAVCMERLGHNGLADAAKRIHPELESVSQTMGQLGGIYSGMTGSGAGFYAAFASQTDATRAYEYLTRQQPDGRVYYCQSTRVGFSESSGRASAGSSDSDEQAYGGREDEDRN